MQEKELDIDLSVHVCYSQKEKEVLQDYLNKHYSPDEAQRLWEKVQQLYVSFLKDQPHTLEERNALTTAWAAHTTASPQWRFMRLRTKIPLLTSFMR